eukprot:TRINITY_DN33033_c0_g1_i1.p1 TRINITY_DN33033_c0_g1~~TRINITY_DN33033_c0_g1_i1.p1  ORF type:complete len:732 (-),score=117.91 TRINITY_DN33033_c0_g1_i1:179-2374(-)
MFYLANMLPALLVVSVVLGALAQEAELCSDETCHRADAVSGTALLQRVRRHNTEAGELDETGSPPESPKPKPEGKERTVFLLPKQADVRMLLPAIPASVYTTGEPAILVMPDEGDDTTSADDWLGRYFSETTYLLGMKPPDIFKHWLGKAVELNVSSPCSASTAIARQVWKRSQKLVVASCGDYKSALMAAPLAAKEGVPLILLEEGMDLAALATELEVQEVIHVGEDSHEKVQGLEASTSNLKDAGAVYEALGKPNYLAVANPADKDMTVYQGLSALAPMLAGLRKGAVLALDGGANITASDAEAQIRQFTASNGIPKYLALVGGHKAIPPHCDDGQISHEEKCRDAPYADLDEDIFLDTACGRIVARHLSSGSLLVSRIGNYFYAREEKSLRWFATSGLLKTAVYNIVPAMTNGGFESTVVSRSMANFTKRLRVAALIHADHSDANGLGDSFSANSTMLFSPMMVTSAGCSTAGLGKLEDPMSSIVLTFLHYGAIGFVGGPRNNVTASGSVHGAFWNAVVQGKSIGEAFQEGWNDVAVNHEDQDGSALAEYVMTNIGLYGDPAFKVFIPGAPAKKAAAMTTLNETDDTVTVTGPQEWTRFEADNSTTHEWKWPGSLYYYGAPGAVVQRNWTGKYDSEYPYYYARVAIPSGKHVQSVHPLSTLEAPLGFSGAGQNVSGGGHGQAGDTWHVDKHSDNSSTLLFRVRLLTYDYETGEIDKQFKEQKYEIVMS